jgi:large subunit ribosomal protein L15
MKIHELNLESAKDKKRVGRGIGSGYGKTAGRGTKGQNARTGGGVRIGFEGGQNPLAKRLPKKRGFTSLSRIEFQVVNLSVLDRFKAGSVIDAEALANAGLVKKADGRVKLLASGELSKKLTLKVNAASATARKAIEAAGGSVEIVAYVKADSKKRTRPAEEASVSKAAPKAGKKSAPVEEPVVAE